MEWVGWFSLIIIIYYSSYPEKVKKLEAKVKKLERKQEGDLGMSKIIESLIGQDCKIKTHELVIALGRLDVDCTILDVDEDWVKLSYVDKKEGKKIKILRVEEIKYIELAN